MNPTDSPSFWQRAWNLGEALAAFVADGCHGVSADEYRARLTICQGCAHRSENLCQRCGCCIPLKALGRAMQCPIGSWPPLADPSKFPPESAVHNSMTPSRTGF
jgi:hypothetical protein